jgi:hypothetical protein
MALIPGQFPNPFGAVITFSPADPLGDSFNNGTSGTTFIVFNNDALDMVMTVDSPGTCNFGVSANPVHDLDITIPARQYVFFRPDQSRFDNPSAIVNVTYSKVANLSVAVVL